MLDPISMNNLAKERHQEMIADAAVYRRTPKAGNNSLQRFGQLLISLGQKIQGQPQQPFVDIHPALNTQ